MTETFETLFGSNRVMVVLRGLPPQETVEIAHCLWDAKVELLEVPIGSPDQVAALRAAVAAGTERGRFVGAGTVITTEQVRAAATAGARYTVAPGLDLDVLTGSVAAGLPHLPGVATATEVQRAYTTGCRWVKVFPASTLGPNWFRAIRGPFPDMNLLATGGVTLDAASAYLDAGAQVVAFGAAATDPAQRDQLADLVQRTNATRRDQLPK